MIDTIEISKLEYFNLLKCELKLSMLDNGGVDNWEWYDESLFGSSLEEKYPEGCKRIKKEVFGND